jgi:hypothetical protein
MGTSNGLIPIRKAAELLGCGESARHAHRAGMSPEGIAMERRSFAGNAADGVTLTWWEGSTCSDVLRSNRLVPSKSLVVTTR